MQCLVLYVLASSWIDVFPRKEKFTKSKKNNPISASDKKAIVTRDDLLIRLLFFIIYYYKLIDPDFIPDKETKTVDPQHESHRDQRIAKYRYHIGGIGRTGTQYRRTKAWR